MPVVGPCDGAEKDPKGAGDQALTMDSPHQGDDQGHSQSPSGQKYSGGPKRIANSASGGAVASDRARSGSRR